MNKKFGQFALPVLLFAFVGMAQAAPLDIVFDSTDGSSFFNTDPWEVTYIDAYGSKYDGTAYRNVADSMCTAGFSCSGWVASSYRAATFAGFSVPQGLFDLDGLWLASAGVDQTLTITGYLNGSVVFTDDNVKITSTAQLFSFTGFKGIDQFSIETTGAYNTYWALGGMTITPVPEPETYAMLLAGLGLLGVVARRRRRS